MNHVHREHPKVGCCYSGAMWRSRWSLVLGVVLLIASSACSGGGEPSAEVNHVTAPTDPLSAVKTFETAPASTPPPSTGAPATTIPVVTVPAPYNARGRALFVSPAGSDSSSGSSTSPFRTIAKGMASALPGDTVFVRAGTYSEVGDQGVVMIRDKHGTADQWITLAAYPGERPVINAAGWDPKNVLWRLIGVHQSSYIEVRGFELVGTAGIDHQPATGVELLDAHHVRVIDNHIHDVGGAGFASIFSNHYDVLNNVIWSTSFWNSYQTSGISSFQAKNLGGPDDSDGYSIRFRNNVVHSVENVTPPTKGQPVTDGNCIIVDEHRSFGYTGSTLIDNNLCFNNGGRGINVLRGDRVMIVNNTLYRNLNSPGMHKDGELSVVFSADVTLRNNLVVARSDRKEVVVIDSTSVFDRNLYGSADAKKQGATDISTDATLFRDADNFDFRLANGSAAVDAGSAANAPAMDLSGRPRTGTPDIGALESVN